MPRRLLKMILTAVFVCGTIAASLGATGAQGPIAQEQNTSHKTDTQTPMFLALDSGGPVIQGASDRAPAVDPGGPVIQGAADETSAPPDPGENVPEGQGPQLGGSVAEDTSDLTDIPPDQEALYQEVRALRKIVDRLRLESEAREHLRATEDDEEARDRDAEILEAAGREYSLQPVWVLGMDLSVNYSYYAYDVIRYLDQQNGNNLEYHSNHTIHNNFSLSSGIRENLTASVTIPFVYKYDEAGTAQSKDITNLGDISLNLQYQPLKTGQGYPSPIFSFSYTMPSGKSPYDINPQKELSTGSGVTSMSAGISLSQPFDPVNVFGSINYGWSQKEKGIGQIRPGAPGLLDAVDSGGSLSASLGFGYAVSYRMSLTLGLSYSYMFSTDYHWLQERNYDDGFDKSITSTGDAASASLNIGTSWRITRGRTIIVGAGWGLTAANPGFSISIRLPLSYDFR